MKKVKIIATAAALAVGGFCALESAADGNTLLSPQAAIGTGAPTNPNHGNMGWQVFFNQDSMSHELQVELCNQVNSFFCQGL